MFKSGVFRGRALAGDRDGAKFIFDVGFSDETKVCFLLLVFEKTLAVDALNRIQGQSAANESKERCRIRAKS